MTHGSLFSGIGGFDLAAEWMGWKNVFHCEINPFCQKVLKYHFPNAVSYEDIKKTDFTKWKNRIDIISGGFPCQPYSVAGKRKGKDDDRHLWPEMLRAIREIQPSWVVGENVYGLVNWSEGLVFHEVQTDLETEGYEVFPYVLPACSANAPHRRDRVWFIAYSDSNTKMVQGRNGNCNNKKWNSTKKIQEWQNEFIGIKQSIRENATYTEKQSSRGELQQRQGKGKFGRFISENRCIGFDNFPTQSPICGGDDGFPAELDGITFPKWRAESIKAYGNAIVPQVVYQIFKAIEQFELINDNT